MVTLGVGFLGESGPNAPIVLGIKIFKPYCFASSNTLCIPSMFTLTVNGTFCSPTALKRAEKWINQSIRWSTISFCSPLKSRISAKTYGPFWTISFDGFTMSERITFSLPYFFRRSLAHSVPNWPKPPESPPKN